MRWTNWEIRNLKVKSPSLASSMLKIETTCTIPAPSRLHHHRRSPPPPLAVVFCRQKRSSLGFCCLLFFGFSVSLFWDRRHPPPRMVVLLSLSRICLSISLISLSLCPVVRCFNFFNFFSFCFGGIAHEERSCSFLFLLFWPRSMLISIFLLTPFKLHIF